MSQSSDIIVVGGGVIGVNIAWALAKRKAGRVILLEKSFLGSGSSGKSGAIVRLHYSNRLTVEMAQKSLRVFENFAEIMGGPPVFTKTGLVLVVDEKDKPGLETNLTLHRNMGIKTGIISHLELAEIDPNARLAENEIAAFESEAGYVEAVRAVQSTADAACREGVDIRQGVEVKKIIQTGGKFVGVDTNEGRYTGGTAILATGPWAAHLANEVGIKLPVQPSRTQVALFRKPTDFGKTGPVFFDFVQGMYFKPTHGDILHSGSIKGEEINFPVDPDEYNESADGDWLPFIRKCLAKRCPAMNRGFGRGGFGALYGITPDWHPILDKLPGMEGVYCSVGFSGHGFKLSPMVGILMAELVIDGSAKTLEISPLRLSRFEQNDLVKTPYSYGVLG